MTQHEAGTEPPLKRFRDLYESLGTNQILDDGFENDPDAGGLTQLQAETASNNETSQPAGNLNETILHDNRGVKRKYNADLDAAAMIEAEQGAITKRRTIEHPVAAEVALPDSAVLAPENEREAAKVSSVPGKPDVDAAFLKAIASARKGRKRETSYDPEFNDLRISKPDTGEEQADEWALVERFDDIAIKGNFMVVVEMDGFKKNQVPRSSNQPENSKPNFKKFKKVNKVLALISCSLSRQNVVSRNRPSVELFTDENDYGMGSSMPSTAFVVQNCSTYICLDYWKGNNSESQTSIILPSRKIQQATKSRVKLRAKAMPLSRVDYGDDFEPVIEGSSNRSFGA